MAFGLGLAGLMGGVQGLGLGMSDIADQRFKQQQFDIERARLAEQSRIADAQLAMEQRKQAWAEQANAPLSAEEANQVMSYLYPGRGGGAVSVGGAPAGVTPRDVAVREEIGGPGPFQFSIPGGRPPAPDPGVDVPGGINPAVLTKLPRQVVVPILQEAVKQRMLDQADAIKYAREQRDLQSRAAAWLQPGPPEFAPTGALGEDPEASAPIPAIVQAPPSPENQQMARLAAAGYKDEFLKMVYQQQLGAAALNKLLGGTPGGGVPTGEDLLRPRNAITANPVTGETTVRQELPPSHFLTTAGLLADAGWDPKMPGYRAAFGTVDQQLTSVEGVGVFGKSSVVPAPPAGAGGVAGPDKLYIPPPPAGAAGTTTPGQPQPLIRVDKPVSPETMTKITGAVRAHDALINITDALKNPEVDNFLGPYDQHRSTVMRMTPNQALGQVPEDVIKLEQGIGTMNNYTIQLITGAAVRKDEEQRIYREMPNQANPPAEFRQRVLMTMANIAKYEAYWRNLALTGNQQAKMRALELGLIDDQGQPTNVMKTVIAPTGEGVSGGPPSSSTTPPGYVVRGKPQDESKPPQPLSRTNPNYKSAKQHGWSDENIEKYYNVRIVD
jgi:hypothetical protein